MGQKRGSAARLFVQGLFCDSTHTSSLCLADRDVVGHYRLAAYSLRFPYKQGLDYSEYKQGLADIASKGPLGHGRRRTLLAYDQISHWRDEKKKSLHRGGWCAIIPWLAIWRKSCWIVPSDGIKTLRDKCEFPEYSEEHELGHHIR